MKLSFKFVKLFCSSIRKHPMQVVLLHGTFNFIAQENISFLTRVNNIYLLFEKKRLPIFPKIDKFDRTKTEKFNFFTPTTLKISKSNRVFRDRQI